MKNLFTVEGKVIVITGATGILGQSMVAHFAEQGAKVVILGRNAEVDIEVVVGLAGGTDHHKGARLGTRRGELEMRQRSAQTDVRQHLVGLIREHRTKTQPLTVHRRGYARSHLDERTQLIGTHLERGVIAAHTAVLEQQLRERRAAGGTLFGRLFAVGLHSLL